MKLEIDFRPLDALMQRMGAAPSDWTPSSGRLDPRAEIRRELEAGKEILLEEVETAHGGLLAYQGEQVVLYIMDTRKSRETLLYEIERAPRFHIFYCKTLEDMRYKGRFERYVVTTRKDGSFSVTSTDPYTRQVEELEAELLPCKNCLNALNWDGFSDANAGKRDRIWKGFSLDDFFLEYATFFKFKPKHSDKTAPIGGYVADWSRLSREYREERNWTCEECRVRLDKHKSLLHVHHKNGVVTDNSGANLAALCVACHAKQPSHQHLRPSAKQRIIIETLRADQRA